MELVLKEINGFATEEITDKDGKVVYKKGQALNTFAHMTDDGKTAGGCWIYTGVTVEGPDGKLVNKANARKPADEKDYLGARLGLRVAGQPAHPLQPRLRRSRRASPGARRRSSSGGIRRRPATSRTRRASGWASTCPTSTRSWPRDAKNGDKPFIMRADLVGAFFGPLNDGPFPEHYEPVESPTKNLLSKQQINPVAKIWDVPDQKNDLAPVGSPDYPVRHHHLPAHRAPPVRRHVALPAHARRAVPLPLRRDQPRAGRGARASPTASKVTVSTPARQGPRDRHGHAPPQAVHDRRQEGAPDRRALALGLQRRRWLPAARATSPTTSPRPWATPPSTSRRPRPSSAT